MKTNYIPQNIWFIDSDPKVNQLNKKLCKLCNFGSNISTYTSLRNALSDFSDNQNKDNIPDLIFLDLTTTQLDDLELLEKTEELFPDCRHTSTWTYGITNSRIIFLSSTEPKNKPARIQSKIQTKFLPKPLTRAHLESMKLFFFFNRRYNTL